jgi:hypothetical protein
MLGDQPQRLIASSVDVVAGLFVVANDSEQAQPGRFNPLL